MFLERAAGRGLWGRLERIVDWDVRWDEFIARQGRLMEAAWDAYLVEGTLEGVEEGKLVVDSRHLGKVLLSPGFDITPKFLSEWLGETIKAFVVNDRVVQIMEYF